jgi:hypothetical protein
MDQGLEEFYQIKQSLAVSRRDLFQAHGDAVLRPQFYTQIDYKNVSQELSLYQAIALKLKTCPVDRPLCVLYSGGIDSEMILDVALREGLKPIALIVDLFGVNRYELKFAENYLEKTGIDYLKIEISEKDFREKWLPELLFDTESMSYLLAGAYIGARACPRGATIVYSGSNPDLTFYDQGQFFLMRHEYSLWPQKIKRRYDLNCVEIYSDPNVMAAFYRYPAICDRIQGPVPFDKWSADHEMVGKEFFYNDRDFAHLVRRYSAHGWEAIKGSSGYYKELIANVNPHAGNSKADSHNFLNILDLPGLIYKMIQSPELDYDFARDFLAGRVSIEREFEDIEPELFSGVYYTLIGSRLENGEVELFPQGNSAKVLTDSSGEILEHSWLS